MRTTTLPRAAIAAIAVAVAQAGPPTDAAAQELRASWLDDLLVTDDESVFMKFARTTYSVTGPDSWASDRRDNSYEFMKQYVLRGPDANNGWRTGWRFDAYVDRLSIAVGDEVLAEPRRLEDPNDAIHQQPMSVFPESLRMSSYLTAGLRIDDYGDERDSWSGYRKSDTLTVGPQFGGGVVAEGGRWRVEAIGLGFAGYRHHRYESRDYYYRPYVDREDDAALGIEARLNTSFRLSEHARLESGLRTRVSSAVDYFDNALASYLDYGVRSDAYVGLTLTW